MSRWALLLATAGALTFAATATGAEPLGPTPASYSKTTTKALAKLPLRKQVKYLTAAAEFYHRPVVAYLTWSDRATACESSPPVGYCFFAEEAPEATALLVPHVACAALGVRVPPNVCWHARAWRRAQTRLRTAQTALAAELASTACGATAAACAWYWDGATQCEVSYEGWFTTDTNPTYKGRFQMDLSFETETPFGKAMEARYGRANNWPEGAQIQHAYEVWTGSGWSRWPPYYVHGCGRWHGRKYPGKAAV